MGMKTLPTITFNNFHQSTLSCSEIPELVGAEDSAGDVGDATPAPSLGDGLIDSASWDSVAGKVST